MEKSLFLIIGVLALIEIITLAALHFKGKKIDGAKVLTEVDSGLNFAKPIADALKPFLPGIAGNIIDAILKYSKMAVESAETTYKDALLDSPEADDTRKADAKIMITNALKLNGIAVTQDTTKLIDAVIPIFVMFLPKTHEDVVTETVVEPEPATIPAQ